MKIYFVLISLLLSTMLRAHNPYNNLTLLQLIDSGTLLNERGELKREATRQLFALHLAQNPHIKEQLYAGNLHLIIDQTIVIPSCLEETVKKTYENQKVYSNANTHCDFDMNNRIQLNNKEISAVLFHCVCEFDAAKHPEQLDMIGKIILQQGELVHKKDV
jgi:hypothetical protein